MSASFTTLEPLSNPVRLLGIEVSKPGNLELGFFHEQISTEVAFHAAKQQLMITVAKPEGEFINLVNSPGSRHILTN